MEHNIIEISSDNKELGCYRGFLRIKDGRDIIKDVPFDSILALMVTARAVIYTNNLLQALCEYGIPLVIVSKNFHPSGILLSLIGQQKQSDIQKIQIDISKPLQKNLWARIIKEKLKNQSNVLDLFQKQNLIKKLPEQVLSGDTSNIEGQGARKYFPALFGSRFIRNPDFEGVNSFLNYGYAIIRATIARLVVASGLNPSFGLKHYNKLNPFCLVDDLIEPYRPIVDAEVYNIFWNNSDVSELTPNYKKQLVGIIHKEFFNGEGYSSLYNIIQRDIWDFVKSIKEKKDCFNFNQFLIVSE